MGSLLELALRLVAPARCAACDATLRTDAVFCGACLTTLEPPPPLPAGLTASFAFFGAVATAVRRLKYEDRVDLVRPLRRLVRERLPAAEVDLVVPVASHPRRLRARGFDAPALLSREVARVLGVELRHDVLTRVVDTPRLASSDDAESRRRAVAGAFVARRCRGARVLLVDDVRTTGATLAEAARALMEAGAVPPRAHVLAATPLV